MDIMTQDIVAPDAARAAMPQARLIEVKGVSKEYRRGKVSVPALARLDLALREGEFVALMGSSGCGKTTLLNLVGGLDRPSAGEIVIAGTAISRLDSAALAQWRSLSVGFVFQFYNLLPALSAAQNVELPLLLRRMGRLERRRRVDSVLDLVGLRDRRTHRPHELSGGQQQRVAIARALVADPQILLCDEPTGDLDRESSAEIMAILSLLHTERHCTLLLATHDRETAAHAERIVVLSKAHATGFAGAVS